ncbi:MAG: electron transport complex subunit RsxG [Gammaproteobacteria bacterium]
MQMIRQSVSRNSIILGIFAIATTGMIVLTANLTRDSIAKAVEDTLKKSLFEVMPRDRLDNDLLNDQLSLPADKLLGTKSAKAAYVAKQHGDPTGVILQAVAPEGYGGSINLLVGIDSQGAITGVRVIPPHFETPGLGDAVEVQKSPWILSFNGKSLANTPESRWWVKKDGGEFDAFTGATITPRAVVDAVYKALQYFDANKASLLHADTAAVTSTQEAATDVGH